MNLSFLRNPKILFSKPNKTFKNKILQLLNTLMLFMFVLFLWVIILSIIDFFYYNHYRVSLLDKLSKNQTQRLFNSNIYYDIIKILFLAPILEEIAFRGLLNLKKNSVIISLSMLCFIYVGDKLSYLDINNFGTWFKFLSVIVIVVIGYKFLSKRHLNYIKNKYYILLFYIMACFFAFDHTSVYINNLPKNLLVITPLFVLPQFFLSVFSGYLRVKNGLLWSILFHFLCNLPISINHIVNH